MTIIDFNVSIGLAGAHRVGKSTLAAAYADKYEMIYIPSRVTDVVKGVLERGADPNTLDGLIAVQRAILHAHIADTDAVRGKRWISDRTSLDMLVYTGIKASRLPVSVSKQEFADKVTPLMRECVQAAPRYAAVVMVQPGIDYVEVEGKPRENYADQVVFNMVLEDALDDVFSNGMAKFIMPCSVLDLSERVAWLHGAERSTVDLLDEAVAYLNNQPELETAE